jgi:hypothetical protein
MNEQQFIEFIKYFQEHDAKYAFGLADLSEDNCVKDFYRIPSEKLSYKILGADKKGGLCIVFDKSILRSCIDSKRLKKIQPSILNYLELIKKGKDVLGDVEYIKQLESGFDKFIEAWNDFLYTLEDEISK